MSDHIYKTVELTGTSTTIPVADLCIVCRTLESICGEYSGGGGGGGGV